MTTRERAAEIVRRISLIHLPDDNVRLRLMTAIEAALAAAYEEGANELIINAQVEYLRGQREEREATERLLEEIIPQILDEGNSESTVKWDFNSQFDDVRALEREVFVSDVFCTLAERRDGIPRIHFGVAIRAEGVE